MIVSHRGADLHYLCEGQGPVCFVLSAIGSSPYQRQLPAELAEHLTLVFIDPRGAGRSTGDASELTFDLLTEDLEAVRRALSVEKVAVFGHSILGALAIEYGRRCPDTVSCVVTAGTPPCGDMARVAAAAQAFFEQDASEERKTLLAQNLAQLPSDAPPGMVMLAETPKRFFDPSFNAAPLFAGAEVKPAFFAHLFGALTPSWQVTEGEALRVPLHLLHGRYDYVVPYHLWDEILSKLPTAQRELFEQSGHQPFVDEPEKFVATLRAALS
jgi:proline iminopeptidase